MVDGHAGVKLLCMNKVPFAPKEKRKGESQKYDEYSTVFHFFSTFNFINFLPFQFFNFFTFEST